MFKYLPHDSTLSFPSVALYPLSKLEMKRTQLSNKNVKSNADSLETSQQAPRKQN